jgi:hypothetical protein
VGKNSNPCIGDKNSFGFSIVGAPGSSIVIEASTNLHDTTSWFPLQNLTLTNGFFLFSDPDATNYPSRFYRFRSP